MQDWAILAALNLHGRFDELIKGYKYPGYRFCPTACSFCEVTHYGCFNCIMSKFSQSCGGRSTLWMKFIAAKTLSENIQALENLADFMRELVIICDEGL